MRLLLLSVLILSLSACQILYRLPTRQGNILDQRDIDKLQVGMTREQVKFVMGTPIATTPFRDDRWDYFGYYKSPRGDETQRTVSLYFEDGKLAHMEGIKQAKADTDLSSPDMKAVESEVKKDRAERRGSAPGPNRDESPIPSGTP